MLNPENWQENLTALSTSPVRCSHFTLGNPKKSFSTILFIYFRLFTLPQKKTNSNCCTAALAVYLLLFSASYYLHSLSTASGACYRRSSTCIDMDMLRLAAVACCDTGWISAQRGTMRLISVEKDWKHVSMQKVFTLNTGSDIACLTFQLPHITTGSFQSQRWQSTTGSHQSLQHLKERNKPSVRWKSFALHKLVCWHFQVGWASRLQFVFFWGNVNNQRYAWLILLKMTFLDFPG